MRSVIRMRKNNGEVQGMPLVLIIMVIVAVLVLGFIFVIWPIIEDMFPKTLNIYGENGEAPGSVVTGESFTLWIVDGKKNGVSGVTVSWEGCSISGSGSTDSEGKVTISTNGAVLFGKQDGVLHVKAQKSDYTTEKVDIIITAS